MVVEHVGGRVGEGERERERETLQQEDVFHEPVVTNKKSILTDSE